MRDRLREFPDPRRDMEVRTLIVWGRHHHVLDDPTFWDYFEEQVAVEPFPTLLAEMSRR